MTGIPDYVPVLEVLKMSEVKMIDGSVKPVAEVMAEIADKPSWDDVRSILGRVQATELSKLYLADKPKDGQWIGTNGSKLWNSAVARSFVYHWNDAAENRKIRKADFFAETGCDVKKDKYGNLTCKTIETIANKIRKPVLDARRQQEATLAELTEAIDAGKHVADLSIDDFVDDHDAGVSAQQAFEMALQERQDKVASEVAKLEASIKTLRETKHLASFPRGRDTGGYTVSMLADLLS